MSMKTLIMLDSDGAEMCGTFCTVHNVVQQLSLDGHLDVFSTIRQLQIRRPELCFSMVIFSSKTC